MKIWKTAVTLEQLNSMNPDTIHTALGIQFIGIGDDYLEASMPVDHRTKNPVGILHGGASVVLAESLGSVASLLVSGLASRVAGEVSAKICVGLEINASHLNSARSGNVIGRATPIRLGKTIHVWNIQIRDGEAPDSKPICQSRLTVMVK